MSTKRWTGAGIALFMSISLSGQDGREVERQNRRLQSEIALARKPVSYVVMDFASRAVILKSRGMVLRQWPIQKLRIWGKPLPDDAVKLVKKTALAKPKRANITPGAGESKKQNEKPTAAFEPETLELKHMPLHYSLVFENAIRVSVRPRTKRFWPALVNVGTSLSWWTFLPLKTVFFAMRGKKFTQIELVMSNEKDAQGIYWALLDGHQTIFQK